MLNLWKPEYLWRPSQIWRRLSFQPSGSVTALPLPWNCAINASSSEVIGSAIATQGVYDLPLTEAIMRLTDSGDTALDIGANIGYMTLVLALSAGVSGRVCCFEPNPDVISKLRANVEYWGSLRRSLPLAPIEIRTLALSNRNGDGSLGFPTDYGHNLGVASLETGGQGITVSLRRLDSLDLGAVGTMKVDVEGHEASVFEGAQNLLAGKLIRDILFEEHEPYPARSHRILLDRGYRIFRLTRSLWRPLLLPPESPSRQPFLPSNYLATADAPRAANRFQARGWMALSKSPRRN
jgi:FkbM family methyltransferase